MAQRVSGHLNRSSGYERSGPQCRSHVPTGPRKSPQSELGSVPLRESPRYWPAIVFGINYF